MRKKKLIQEFVDRLLAIKFNAELNNQSSIIFITEKYIKEYVEEYGADDYFITYKIIQPPQK